MIKPFEMTKLIHTHIGGWIMPEDVIDDIIDYWNKPKSTKYKEAGKIFGANQNRKIDTNVKDSSEMWISAQNYDKPWDTYRKYLQDCLEAYLSLYPESEWTNSFSIHENYNLQWYQKGGGYHTWHHENDGSRRNIHRHLVFMTYLNDATNAGTQFKYQNITTPCVKGLTLIWPATHTHVHKGQISETHEKAVVTGWYSFDDIFEAKFFRLHY